VAASSAGLAKRLLNPGHAAFQPSVSPGGYLPGNGEAFLTLAIQNPFFLRFAAIVHRRTDYRRTASCGFMHARRIPITLDIQSNAISDSG
jgi:hypothetical protein